MKELILDLKALEPVVVTDGPAEGMSHECLGYIPGNMLLGAMAAVWVRSHPGEVPDDSAEFRRLFLDGDVWWGHALPACAHGFSVPVPLSFCRVKNMDGLPENGEPFNPANFGVIDRLALADGQSPQECWQEYHQKNNPAGTDGTGAKIRRIAPGFMDPESLRRVKERKVWNIHVALESGLEAPENGASSGNGRRAREGQLFGYSAIAAGSRFTARVSCRTGDAEADLEKLVAGVRSLRIGHARSAGYGHVGVSCRTVEATPAASIKGRRFSVFLASQYLPNPSWSLPFESLKRELAVLAGKEPDVTRSYVVPCEIMGYNGHWNCPRATRHGLAMGSVLEISFGEEVSLPASFAAGALRQEGYGKILCNPKFLGGPIPAVGRPGKVDSGLAESQAPESSDTIWRLLRERAAERLAMEQAERWLHSEAWKKFLDDVSGEERPGASQRNNLREMTADQFLAMLDKTPGAQWRQATAHCPFTGRRDHLSRIMPGLLDPEKFLQVFPLELRTLPGGEITHAERTKFGRKAHGIFVQLLVQAWGKKSNLERSRKCASSE